MSTDRDLIKLFPSAFSLLPPISPFAGRLDTPQAASASDAPLCGFRGDGWI